MKRLLLIFLLIQIFSASAQDSQGNDYYFGENFHFNGYSTDKRMMVRSDIGFVISDKYISHIFENFDNNKTLPGKGLKQIPNSPILLGIKLNPKLKNFISPKVQNLSKTYHSYFIPDSSDAIIIAMGINKDNYKDFLYRVVENDSIELTPWTPIPTLSIKYGAKVPYGSIGTFNYPEKLILVEVRHRKIYGIRDGYILDWRKNKRPILEQIIARGPSEYGYFNLLDRSFNKGYVHQYDEYTGAPLDLTFNKDSITSLNLEFENHDTTPYSVQLIKKTENSADTIQLEWWTQAKKFEVSNKYLNEIGEYELLIHKTGDINTYNANEILRIPYHIVQAPQQFSATLWPILWPTTLISLTIIVIAFFTLRYRTRKRLVKVEQKRQTLTLQIKNIQSQLNPHFMFNAINSIQNL
ncbi:MAG: histidine kinase, partial [Sphingobacterium sp.]|nr:histidine kinase [Sphingobacterium sp.]